MGRRVTGGWRFAVARARAALPTLVTIGIVAAIAAALATATAASIQAVEARDVRAALVASSGDRVELSVSADSSGRQLVDAVESALDELGLGPGLVVSENGADVVLRPDPEAVTAADIEAMAARLGDLRDVLEGQTQGRVQVSGGLADTAETISDGLTIRRGPTAVAVGILGVVIAVVVGAVAMDAVRLREGENRLLRARGARRRQLASLAGSEAGVIALGGAAVGAALASATAIVLGGAWPGWLFVAVLVPAIALVAAITVIIGTARGADGPSARARVAAGASAAVILAVVTGVAAWLFWQAGTPVVERGDGTIVIDPLVAIAPALVLALTTLLAVVVATPLARALAAALRGSRGSSPITPLRLASRRPGRHALPITVVAFAVGAVTVAGTYQASIQALGDSPEALRVGADVRIVSIPADVDPSDVAASSGADATMLARPLTAGTTQQRLQLLAAQSPQLGAVMLDAGGAIDPAAMGEAVALSGAGVPLAGDTIAFRLLAPVPPPFEVDGEQFVPTPISVYGRLTIAAESGAVARFEFANADTEIDDFGGVADVDPDVALSFDLPPGESWSLAAIEIAANPFGYWPDGTADVVEVSSGGARVDLSGFRPSSGTTGSIEVIDDGLRFTPGYDGMDFPYTRAVAGDLPTAVPAVITAATAASLSLDIDEAFSLELSSPDADVDFVVSDIVPVLPGTASGEGILVDLATISLASPADIPPNQVWAATDDPGATIDAVHAEYPQLVALVADPRSAQNASGTATAFLVAATGAVILALVILLLRRTRGRADSRELALLAVMGLGRRGAAGLRAREDVFAVLIGVLGGIAAGVATSWLVVPPLVRSAYGTVPDTFPVPLHVDALLLGAAILVTAVACCLVVATVRAPARLAQFVREDE